MHEGIFITREHRPKYEVRARALIESETDDIGDGRDLIKAVSSADNSEGKL